MTAYIDNIASHMLRDGQPILDRDGLRNGLWRNQNSARHQVYLMRIEIAALRNPDATEKRKSDARKWINEEGYPAFCKAQANARQYEMLIAERDMGWSVGVAV